MDKFRFKKTWAGVRAWVYQGNTYRYFGHYPDRMQARHAWRNSDVPPWFDGLTAAQMEVIK